MLSYGSLYWKNSINHIVPNHANSVPTEINAETYLDLLSRESECSTEATQGETRKARRPKPDHKYKDVSAEASCTQHQGLFEESMGLSWKLQRNRGRRFPAMTELDLNDKREPSPGPFVNCPGHILDVANFHVCGHCYKAFPF